jgi:hypothetical protein
LGFGRLCQISLPSSPQQEQVYAQPLVVSSSDGHSMTVYAATMQDKVYAFNVPATWSSQTCSPLRSQTPVDLLDPNHLGKVLPGQHPADACFVGNSRAWDHPDCSTKPYNRAICPSVGVLGTPVIDTTSSTMYVVTESQDNDTGQQGQDCNNNDGKKGLPGQFHHYLHALDLTSPMLAEKNSGPIAIPQIIQGYGAAQLRSRQLLQRPGLLYLGPQGVPNTPVSPTVYVAFSMMDGTSPNPSGWALAYDGGNLGLGGTPLVFATVQNPDIKGRLGGGIWQGGAGLAAGLDANQNNYIYASTGDGQFDSSQSNYGDTVLKLNTDLQLSDYFTPADWDFRWNWQCTSDGQGHDLDLGSGGEMIVPDGVLQDSHYQNIVIKGDKENYIWVIDRTRLGLAGTGCPTNCQPCTTAQNNVLQQFPIKSGQARTTPAFWFDGTTPFLYFAQEYSQLQQYKLNCGYPNGPICSPAASTTNIDPAGQQIGFAATPSVSSDGTTHGTGIVWAIRAATSTPKLDGLYAFDAENLSTVLFQTGPCPNRDGITPTHFSVPTVANGYVFVGAQTDFSIFGTSPPTCQ